MKTILDNLPDKTEYKNTTSKKFKHDIINFFQDKNLDTCLEIGTNHGHTTYVLSHLFKKVFTVDLHQSNIDFAREFNSSRNNIEFITGNAYNKETYKNIQAIDVTFIDCIHTYDGVLRDIQTGLDKASSNGIYFIFDDYGHPRFSGVYNAIEEAIRQGLKRELFIGQQQGYTFTQPGGSTTLIRSEGIILSYGK